MNSKKQSPGNTFKTGEAVADSGERNGFHAGIDSEARSAFFETMFDQSPNATIICDENLKIVDANKAACDLYGYSKEEISALPATHFQSGKMRLIPPQNKDRLVPGISYRFDTFHQRKDDSKIEVEISCHSVEYLGSLLVIASIRENSLWNTPAWELARSENLIEAVLKDSPLLLFAQDLELKYTWFKNLSDEVIFPEIIGKTDYDLFPPDQAAALSELKQEIFKSRKGRHVEGLSLSIADSDFTYNLTIEPIKDSAGEIKSLLCAAWNVTHLRQIENELKQTESLFKELFELLPQPITITELSTGIIINANSAFCKISQYSMEEVIGSSLVELGLYSNAERGDFIELLRKEKHIDGLEMSFTVKDKSTIQGLMFSQIIDWGNNTVIITILLDISGRKNAEDRLLREREFTQLLISNTLDGVIAYDTNLRITEWNRKMESIVGKLRGEVIGRTLPEIFPDLASNRIMNDMKEVITGEDAFLVERYFERIEGVSGFFETFHSPLKKQNKELIGGLAIIHDVTQKKLSEYALLENEERFRLIFENSLDGILLVTIEGVLLSYNRSIQNIFGFEDEKIFRDRFEKLWRDRLSRVCIGNGRSQSDSHFNTEMDLPRFNGEEFPAEIGVAGFADSGGNERFAIFVRDISLNRQVEQDLRLRQKAIETALIGITITDVEGHILYANQAEADLHGYAPDELIGQDIGIFAPSHLRKPMSIKELKDVDAWSRESVNVKRNGEEFPVKLNSKVVYDDNQQVLGVVTICEDITERKWDEEELFRQRLILNGINQIFHEALTSRSEKQLDKLCLEVALDLTESEFGFIWDIDQKGDCEIMLHHRGDSINLAGDNPPVLPDANRLFKKLMKMQVFKDAISTRRPVAVNDWSGSGYARNMPAHHVPLHNILIAPLVYRSKTIGLVTLANRYAGYRQEDISSMESLTVAIVEARMRRWAEDALKKSEATLSEGQKLAQLGNWDVDLITGELYWSEAMFNIFKRPRSLGTPDSSIRSKAIHPDDLEQVNMATIEAFKDGKTHAGEHRIICHDGEVRYVQVREKQIRDATGKPIRIIGTVIDITNRKKVEDELLESRQRLRELSAHLLAVREEERKSIAREIHDELGQVLTALKIDASWIGKKIPEELTALHQKVESMLKLIDDTIQTVKRISSSLRPNQLDDLGIVAAIDWESAQFAKRTGVNFSVHYEGEDYPIDESHSVAIYRIFMEALTNIARHACANSVSVILSRKSNVIELTVRDDGIGFNIAKLNSPGSFGLKGMKERVIMLGGEINIESENNSGTTIVVELPRS